MVIGKGFDSDKRSDHIDRLPSDGNSHEQEGALTKWQQQLNYVVPGAVSRENSDNTTDNPIQKVADTPQIGENGMPISNDPLANQIAGRVAQHMHNYSRDGNPSSAGDTSGAHIVTRPGASSADIANGLWGPESAANAAQYSTLQTDFNTLDSQFTQELAQNNITGKTADEMRQFLYFSADKNQRQQFLNAYHLTEPSAFASFQQKYGDKAFAAIHWAVEKQEGR